MKIPILRLPYSDEEIVELQEGIATVLRSGMLTKGETVTLFEQEWAKYCGTKYAVACTSGTAALEIIFRAIGVEGKEVIIPSNTFIATAAAALRAGAKVVLPTAKPTICHGLPDREHSSNSLSTYRGVYHT